MRWNRFLVLLAAIGLVLYFGVNALYHQRADLEPPTEDPSITKQDAAKAAADFVRERFDTGEPRTFVYYQTEKTRSGYLQKTHLLSAYNQAYGERVPLDYYEVELSTPLEQAHYFVKVNYHTGDIVGWSTRAGGNGPVRLPDGQTERQAGEALVAQGWDPEDFKLQPADTQTPGQLVYEKTSGTIGEAKLQIRLSFTENGELSVYEPGFSIPETEKQWLERQDKSASIMTWISTGFSVLLAIGGVIAAIIARKRMNFRKGLLLTVLFTTIYIVNNLNMYPSFKAMIGTDTYPGAAIFGMVFVNFATLLMALWVYISLAAGHQLWEQAGLTRLSWPGWREPGFGRSVLSGMGRGYLLAIFLLGVQQALFYTGETAFGVWSVNDASNSLLNLLVPGLFPLMAWAAAISEEAAYRVFGIAWFKKLLRFDFIAVLVPSVFWAASHTLYPIYPVYTRLIEVTVIGVILGYAYLKYGFMTTLFAHACMDSILMGLSLLGIGDAGHVVLGAFYVLLPALIALALAWLHKRRGNSSSAVETPA
ncbi:CPBP family intramembrane glutamic endopeptidase [Paenibacillus athensensis]|uniref:CPBP family intramembrane glutamic endopeptidase n=1 Tax=Paenibacillus athensensis TaxID=1967502 RepID=UPI001E62A08B|nr:type II CAAX endopeptidase family protein [Paenibacillus athensensis]